MATTNADQISGDHHQVTAHDDDEALPPPAGAGDGDDLGIDKISKQEDATKELDAAEELSLQDEVAAADPVPADAIEEAFSAEAEAPVPRPETLATLEKPALDEDLVSAPTQSDEKLQDALLLAQPHVKELEGEVKDTNALAPETESNAQQFFPREEREIDPLLSSEATDEPASELPVADSKPQEPQEVAEPQVVPGPVDDATTDRSILESAVVAQVAEPVLAKDVAEDDEAVNQTAAAQEPAVVAPCEPEASPATNEKDAGVGEASTETLVPDADKAAAVEKSTAAEGILAEKMEEGVEDKIAEPEELVSGGTENGTDVVKEKLKVESVQEDDIKQRIAGEEDVSQEKIEKLEEFVSSGTENGTNVVEEKLKDESVLGEEAAEVVAKDVKAEEVEISNPEESVSSGVENYGTNVVEKELEDESLIEKDVKVEEVTGLKTENHEEPVSNGTENVTDVVGGKEGKDESLLEEVKAKEVDQNVSANAGDVGGSILVKDVAGEQNIGAAKEDAKETEVEETNEAESVKEVAAKPPKADDNVPSGDVPVTEVITKSTPKSSGNIISKVKQSLVKVKKAITGKSPASKTAS